MANETATGIMFSENLPEDVNLDELEDFDALEGNGFTDWIKTPGQYIMQLLNIKTQDDGDHTPSENLLLKVTGSETGVEVGQLHLERIYHTARDRALKLGKRMGVWNADQHKAYIESMRAGEPCAGPDFSPCIGHEFVVVLKSEKYNDKQQCKVDYVGIFPMDHPDVAGFIGRVRGDGTPAAATAASSNGAKKPAATSNGTAKVEPAKAATNGKASTATTTTNSSATRKPAPAKKPAGAVDEL